MGKVILKVNRWDIFAKALRAFLEALELPPKDIAEMMLTREELEELGESYFNIDR